MKTKLKKLFSTKVAYWTGIIIFGAILGVSLQLARAGWSEPAPGTVPPTGGNVAAPINTSANAQTKTGPLVVSESSSHGALLDAYDVGFWGSKTLYGVKGIGSSYGVEGYGNIGTYGSGGYIGVQGYNSGSGIFSDLGYSNYGLYTNGLVYTGVGIEFPDGTTQTTAAGASTKPWICLDQGVGDNASGVTQIPSANGGVPNYQYWPGRYANAAFQVYPKDMTGTVTGYIRGGYGCDYGCFMLMCIQLQ